MSGENQAQKNPVFLRRVPVFAMTVSFALMAGCGDAPATYVIAGPTAPSRVATAQPYVWDSREELLDWVSNAVTRGPIAVEGDGVDAFVRVRLDGGNYVMRGPDLDPNASGVRGARVRARLRHDRPRPSLAVQTEPVELFFEVVNANPPNTQPSMRVDVGPSDDWQELTLKSHLYCCTGPLTVRYAYIPLRSTVSTTLDIDRIEFVR